MMSDDPNVPCQATPSGDLEFQIVSSTVPKNEREWWAHHEIERLRTELAEAREEIERLRVPPELAERYEEALTKRGAIGEMEWYKRAREALALCAGMKQITP